MQIWLDIVPDGTYRAASLPSRAATRSCRRLMEGSSLKTSSPTSAAARAARMPGVGRVTVSLRKSMSGSAMSGFTRVDEVPAVIDLAEADDTVLDVLESEDGRGVQRLQLALVEEAPQQLDRRRVEAARRLLYQVPEAAGQDVGPGIDPVGVGQLGEQVVEALQIDGLEDGGQRLLRACLGEALEVRLDAVPCRRRFRLIGGRQQQHSHPGDVSLHVVPLSRSSDPTH